MSWKLVVGKSATKEFLQPITGTHLGQIPSWLNGSLYRNGPAKYEVGNTQYSHLFDGLAILQKFEIQNGTVTYRSQFLRSDTYLKNMAANRIVVSEFGTLAFPDPCKNIFSRYVSLFTDATQTDNTSVNVFPVHDQLFAATETNLVNRIDPISLDRVEQVNLSQYVSVNMATAHPHLETDGTVHNLGSSFSEKGGPHYCIIKVPPHDADQSVAFQKATIAAKIPARWKFHPAYHHSFGMSENYYVVFETPLAVSAPKIWTSTITRTPFNKALQWHDNEKVLIHLVHRETGQRQTFVADAFFCFHFINCFEEKDHVVVDCSCYNTGDVISDTNLTEIAKLNLSATNDPAMPRRYVLPLKVDNTQKAGENLITLPDTQCTAIYDPDSQTIHCNPELLANVSIELPTIHYKRHNTQKYQYCYGITMLDKLHQLVKINTQTKTFTLWKEEHCFPTEPIFVARDSSSNEEDDGVILSAVIRVQNGERDQFLLILDAKSFQEIGRVLFPEVSVPLGFHGSFIPVL